jgi:uncharacterized membrane protein
LAKFRQFKMNDQRSSTPTVIRRMLWVGIAGLAAFGVAAAIVRAASVAHGGLSFDQIRLLVPERMAAEALQFDQWFAAFPSLTILHVLFGGIFLMIAPLQLSSRIRVRFIGLHRWTGRILVVVALPVGVSALVFIDLFPYGGFAAASAAFVADSIFLVALVRAVVAIRCGDVTRHREWMIRMFSVALGVANIRIVGMILFAITGARVQDTLGISFWTGWLSTFAAAELWIRYTRSRAISAVETSVATVVT